MTLICKIAVWASVLGIGEPYGSRKLQIRTYDFITANA